MVVLDYGDLSNSKPSKTQINQQARSIIARIFRELDKQFFEGNGSSPNLKGLTNRADATINGGAAALTLAMLYQLRYSVNPSSPEGLGWGANAFFSHPDAFRKVLNLLGTDVSALSWVYNERMNVQVPVFMGCEWYLTQSITVTANITEIYAVNLENIRIWYSTNDEYPADERGIQQIPIPMQDDISEMGLLVSGIYAIENDPGSVAKLFNVNIA